MIDTVLFDFDGTLADTNDLIIASWQYTYRERIGHTVSKEEILKTFGEPLVESMRKAFPEFDVDESIEIYRSFQREIFSDAIKPFPGVPELVKELSARGFKIGVVTSRARTSTYLGLELFGLDPYIDAVITCDDCAEHKPAPGPCLACLEALGSKPGNSVMVGDSKYDIGCANNAGVTSVMVGWSMAAAAGVQYESDGPGDESEDARTVDPAFIPDYTVSSAEEIMSVIRSLEC